MFKDVFWREPKRESQKTSQDVEREQQQQQELEEQQQREEKEEEEEEDYDPFKHRNVSKPTSDYGAMAHILKTSLGSGILAMPMAFRHSGLILGAFGSVFIGIVCTHCVQMLIWNSQVLCKKFRVPIMSFAETAEKAFVVGPERYRRFSRFFGILITVELLASFILGNTVYVVFMSHTMYQVVEFYWEPGIDIRIYTTMLWIPLMLMCMLPNLKSLVPFSIAANIFVLISFSITLYYIFRSIQPYTHVYFVAPIETWPLFLCTVIFAIEGIGTVLSIENEMKNPNHFIGGPCGILYAAMAVVIILYGIVGFFGYLEYGQRTKGSITLNLPMEEALAQAVKGLIALAIFFTYALQFYVPIGLIVRMLNNRVNVKYHFYCKVGVRIGLVTATIIISLVIPHLEPIISLVGAICFSMLGLLFPAMIDTMARYPKYGTWKWKLWKNILIQIMSVVAMVGGAYSSILDIISTYVHLKDDVL